MYKEILCDFNNLRQAYKLAHRGKTNCDEVIKFDENKLYNLHQLKRKLENKQWDQIFKYYRFTIKQPKERIVDALTFEGRIVQHVLCDKILKPYFEPKLIKENCACRENKGTDYALNLIVSGMQKYLKTHDDGYVLKMDVKKYFPSIDRRVLKQLLSKIPDAEILEFLYWIIDNCPNQNGLPIGNQTSQWFALYYINKLDRIIKEKYQIKYYSRYMDDLIIIHEDKQWLNNLYNDLSNFAENELCIIFNNKTQITPLHRGFTYLGWRIKYTQSHKIIKKIDKSKRMFRYKSVLNVKMDFKNNKINLDRYNDRMRSIIQNLEKGNTFHFRIKYNIKLLQPAAVDI